MADRLREASPAHVQFGRDTLVGDRGPELVPVMGWYETR